MIYSFYRSASRFFCVPLLQHNFFVVVSFSHFATNALLLCRHPPRSYSFSYNSVVSMYTQKKTWDMKQKIEEIHDADDGGRFNGFFRILRKFVLNFSIHFSINNFWAKNFYWILTAKFNSCLESMNSKHIHPMWLLKLLIDEEHEQLLIVIQIELKCSPSTMTQTYNFLSFHIKQQSLCSVYLAWAFWEYKSMIWWLDLMNTFLMN